MSDYRYWHEALKITGGRPRDLTRDEMRELVVEDGNAGLGFYRTRRRRDGPLVPAAVFVHEGELVCLLGFKADAVQRDAQAEWQYLAKRPISEEFYRQAFESGQWPDMDEAIRPPPAGHNQPEDEAEAIKDQIESAKAGVSKYEKIKDDEIAAAAQSLRSRLLELRAEADKKREALVRPHLDAQQALNKKWMPLVKDAKAQADKISKALSKYETAKANAAAAEQRKREEAHRKAEDAARKAAEAGRPAPAPEPEPEPAPVPTTTIKGAYGRAASVRVVKVATVDNQDKAYGYLRTHPELVDLIAKLSQRAVNAGHEVPGVTVDEIRKVA